MLSDDLRLRVSLDALRAGVPARHLPARVEHEDRVVGDALDQQAELPFALDQRLLRGAALGDVVRDLGEADELAVLVVDRVDDDVRPEAGPVLADAPAFPL